MTSKVPPIVSPASRARSISPDHQLLDLGIGAVERGIDSNRTQPIERDASGSATAAAPMRTTWLTISVPTAPRS
jgi:hypothetical protein